MSHRPKTPPARTAAWLLIGACFGAAGLLYMRNRRASKRNKQDERGPEKPPSVPEPKPGDILLFHNAKGLNRLITWFNNSPFYHAGIHAGANQTVEARTPGVVRGNLKGREADYVVVPAPEGKGPAALAWAETQVGDAYDDIDLAVIILDHLCRFIHFNYTPRNKYSCGEFVAVAFDKADANLFPRQQLGEVVPGDFAKFLPEIEKLKAR